MAFSPAIRFEVWLPDPSVWNSKFQGEGNGGLAGTISYSAMAPALVRNYATASTDTGHQVTNPDGIWALGHPQLIIDFAYRGTHEMTVKGQAITAAYYGTNASLSYFVGCSNGDYNPAGYNNSTNRAPDANGDGVPDSPENNVIVSPNHQPSAPSASDPCTPSAP